jgi:hypothetical protein
MRSQLHAVTLAALLAVLVPAMAFACEEESAKQTATKEQACAVAQKAACAAKAQASASARAALTIDVRQLERLIKRSIAASQGAACAAAKAAEAAAEALNAPAPCPSPAPKPANAQRSKRQRWSPGHLIEPDSLKLAPEFDPNRDSPQEWITISSRDGVLQIHRHSSFPKRTKGRVS